MAIFGGGNTGGGLGIGIIYSLKDEFSSTADKISSKFSQMDGITAKASANIEKSMNRMKLGFASMAVGAALLAPIAIGINKSIQMSDALSDVTKTTGITGKALQELRVDLESIDTRTSVKNLLEIARAGGTMGVAQKDVAGFTESMDKLNVALGDQFASPEQLAVDLTKMRNVLLDIKSDNISADLLKIGNVLNFMGANSAAAEGEITSVVGRMAGLGQSLGMTSADIFGVSTALLEMGVNAEVAGSNFPIALQRMASHTKEFAKVAGMSTAEFEHLVNTNIVEALGKVAVGAKQLAPTATQMSKLLDGLGLDGARVSEVFLKLASNTDLMRQRVQESGQALTNTDSIMNEFIAKNNNLAAVMEKLKKRFDIMITRVGDAFAPVVEKLGNFLIRVLDIFGRFVSSPFGKFVVKLTGAVAVLLVGVGGLVVAMNAARFMAGKAALAFAQMGQAQIAAAFANKGLIGGMKALAKQAIQTMITMGPIGWILLAVTGVVLLFVKSIQAFKDVLNGTKEPATGFLGFLQRLGGILMGIGAIWKSANSEGFSMTQQMHDALEKLGILDLVVSIGTWIVRVKEFFKGVGQGIKAAYNAVIKPVVNAIKAAFTFLMDTLAKWGINIGKNTSDVSKWAEVGKIVGIVIMATLVPAFIALAISVIAATWPILLIIGAIIGIIAIVKNWSKIMDWFGEIWQQTWGWIKEKVGQFWDWLTGIPKRMFNWGVTLINNLKEGIASAWASFKSWLAGLWETLMAPIKGTLKFLGLGDEGEINVNDNQTITQKQMSSPIGQSITKVQAASVESNQPVVFDKSTQTEVTKNFNIKLDSREISHEIESVQEEKSNRQ